MTTKHPRSGRPANGSLKDPARLRALMRTGLIESDREPALERLTRLAGRLLETPIAALTLIDASQQWVKASVGLGDVREVPLSESFCKFTVESGESLAIVDVATHAITSDDPVLGTGSIRSYLGAPLVLLDGHALGSLCVADNEPREWSSTDLEMLEELAHAAVAEIELRAALAESAARTAEAEAARRALEASQAALHESEMRFRLLSEAAFEGVFVNDGVHILEANRAGAEMFGYSIDVVKTMRPLDLVAPESIEATAVAVQAGAESYETIGLRASGERFPLMVRVRLVEEGGRPLRISVTRDVTEQKRTEQQLSAHAEEMRSLSIQDPLTGLVNRRGFMDGAASRLVAAAQAGTTAGLFYIDVNGMKPVNDELGHGEGDRLLADVAAILRAAFRSGDVVGRIGGDEFAVLAPCGVAAVPAVLARLDDQLASFNASAQRRYQVSLSVGVVNVPPHPDPDLEALMAEADAKMYAMKRSSKAR